MNQWFENKTRGFRQVWAFDNRWHLILQRLLFPQEALTFYRLGSLEILIDHQGGDSNGAREILTSPMYAEHLARLRRTAPLKVLDLGANNGGFALLLARLGFPIARIVCVELNPRTCVRLRFNLDRNFEIPHDMVNAAVCGRSGSLTVRLGGGATGDSIYASHAPDERPVVVRAVTFNEIFVEHFGADAVLDLCKIDIERAEHEVFSSPGHELVDRCRFLIMEIHRDRRESPETLVRRLVDRGFELLPRGCEPNVYAFLNRSLD